MGLGLLPVPALAGYLFLVRFNLTRDSVSRETGYHVVFRAAIVGITLFVAAGLLVNAANSFVPMIGVSWKLILPFEYSGTAAITVILGLAMPLMLNFIPRFNRETARHKVAEQDGDQIGLVVDQAILENQLVELSLTTGKSYVGAPLNGMFGHRDTGDMAIVPVASGFRHNDTRELVITTNYAAVIGTLLTTRHLDQFRVAVPMRDITSARLFDPAIYTAFAAAASSPAGAA